MRIMYLKHVVFKNRKIKNKNDTNPTMNQYKMVVFLLIFINEPIDWIREHFPKVCCIIEPKETSSSMKTKKRLVLY